MEVITKVGINDVLMGRGSGVDKNEGNKRFRVLVRQYNTAYNTTNRHDRKDSIARQIIDTIMQRGGRFLRRLDNNEQHHRSDNNDANNDSGEIKDDPNEHKDIQPEMLPDPIGTETMIASGCLLPNPADGQRSANSANATSDKNKRKEQFWTIVSETTVLLKVKQALREKLHSSSSSTSMQDIVISTTTTSTTIARSISLPTARGTNELNTAKKRSKTDSDPSVDGGDGRPRRKQKKSEPKIISTSACSRESFAEEESDSKISSSMTEEQGRDSSYSIRRRSPGINSVVQQHQQRRQQSELQQPQSHQQQQSQQQQQQQQQQQSQSSDSPDHAMFSQRLLLGAGHTGTSPTSSQLSQIVNSLLQQRQQIVADATQDLSLSGSSEAAELNNILMMNRRSDNRVLLSARNDNILTRYQSQLQQHRHLQTQRLLEDRNSGIDHQLSVSISELDPPQVSTSLVNQMLQQHFLQQSTIHGSADLLAAAASASAAVEQRHRDNTSIELPSVSTSALAAAAAMASAAMPWDESKIESSSTANEYEYEERLYSREFLQQQLLHQRQPLTAAAAVELALFNQVPSSLISSALYRQMLLEQESNDNSSSLGTLRQLQQQPQRMQQQMQHQQLLSLLLQQEQLSLAPQQQQQQQYQQQQQQLQHQPDFSRPYIHNYLYGPTQRGTATPFSASDITNNLQLDSSSLSPSSSLYQAGDVGLGYDSTPSNADRQRDLLYRLLASNRNDTVFNSNNETTSISNSTQLATNAFSVGDLFGSASTMSNAATASSGILSTEDAIMRHLLATATIRSRRPTASTTTQSESHAPPSSTEEEAKTGLYPR